MSKHTTNPMELKVDKGRYNFTTKKDNSQESTYSYFGTVSGSGKWVKILEPDQFGNFSADIYPSDEVMKKIKEDAAAIIDEAKSLIEGAGKKVNGTADVYKEDNEGVQYLQFKRKGSKFDGTPNTPPKIYDAGSNQIEGWNKLIGNGSEIQIAFQMMPYYMASTKMVGVSCRFYALQVKKLVEYSAGGSSSPFGEATNTFDNAVADVADEDLPF